MKTFITFVASFVLVLGASPVSAQTFNSFYSAVNPGVCANLTSDLSIGSKGSQVRALQTFLVAQNYSGGGNWMITGNYGQATAAAVRIFQQQRGLPITGWVDAATRAAINQAGCGNSYGYNNFNFGNTYPDYSFPNNYFYPYNYNNYPYNNYPYNYNNNCGAYPYFYSCQTNTGSAPTITSLSNQYAMPGTSVTVYGTGFDSVNNTVYVGGTTLRNIASYNGTTLTFVVPTSAVGTVSISVANTYGTSNALTLNTGVNPNTCNTYPYYQYGYGSYCPPASNGQISIYPASGGVGTNVTVYGWNFTQTNNTVRFGNGIIANLSSNDGRSISFTVPSSISGYGYQPIGLGSYNVSVTNGVGQTSGSVPFMITSLGGSGNSAAPTITSVSGPTTIAVNTQGTWTLQINNNQTNSYTTTSVNWGDQNVYGAALSANQTTYAQGSQSVSFTHTYTTTGTYTIVFTVTGVNGLSNTSSVTVNVNANNAGNVSLTSLSPSYGPIGTQIILVGTGFTNDNTIYFGIGGKLHVPSFNNGTLMSFTVPQYVAPCDLVQPGQVCTQNIQQVMPGAIQVKVGNSNGTSQTLYFQVL